MCSQAGRSEQLGLYRMEEKMSSIIFCFSENNVEPPVHAAEEAVSSAPRMVSRVFMIWVQDWGQG